MSIIEMDSKIKELRELKRMQEELTNEITSIEDEIKGVMSANEVDVMTGTDWKVTWKTVTSNRLDGKALKAALPDVYGQFCKVSTSRRFTIA